MENFNQKLETALKAHLRQSQLPSFDEYLLGKITGQIDYQRQLRRLLPKLWAALAFLLATLGLLVFASIDSWRAFSHSSMATFLSLMFTDFKVIFNNWQDYAYSILESLPVGATALCSGLP